MLSCNHRLPRTLFLKLLKNSFSFSSHLFICKWNKNVRNRFSVVISQKICKKATERNKKRRQVYEAIKKNQETLQNTSIDIILFGKKTLETATFATIEQDIIFILKKLSHL